MSDWLWDGSGEPDAAERRAQEALRPLAQELECPPLPERAPRRSRRMPAALAAFALAASALFALRGQGDWAVSAAIGPCASGDCALGEGDRLDTKAGESLEIAIDELGRIELSEESGLAREDDSEAFNLRLDRGALALSWHGPPGGVRVETPAASVIDLGCAYTLSVDDEGTALSVIDGTILLKNPLGESYVTGGSSARAPLGAAPSLPLRLDASPEFAEAVAAMEIGAPGALDALLRASRPQDLLTLWNLFARVPGTDRPAVYAAMKRHVPALPSEAPPALLALDGEARSALWRALTPLALEQQK